MSEEKTNQVFMDWFTGPYDANHPVDKRKNFERIAYLVACNGGQFDVRSWGTIMTGPDCFPAGLTQEEGLELIQLGAFINGSNLIDNTVWPYATKIIHKWISDKLEAHEKRTGGGDEPLQKV